jgi:hypothetical protein
VNAGENGEDLVLGAPAFDPPCEKRSIKPM